MTRIQSSLAMLLLLVLVVPALIYFKPSGEIWGTLAFIALIALFRLMGRFENIGMDRTNIPPQTPTAPSTAQLNKEHREKNDVPR